MSTFTAAYSRGCADSPPFSHQWIFITDTVDAIYRPDEWYPEALMDQLSDTVGQLPVSDGNDLGSTNADGSFGPSTPALGQRHMRRPMLNSLRQVDTVRDLLPFFSHISIASYESVYASGGVIDWEAVEEGIIDNMFDGR